MKKQAIEVPNKLVTRPKILKPVRLTLVNELYKR